jgi:VIT1/CCC1 family predicted Fe2+/Mn2+ transporter
MYTNKIVQARNEKLIYALRAGKIGDVEIDALNALDDSITVGLGVEDRKKVLDLIAAGNPGTDPSTKRYRPCREDWYYALGILGIDVLLVFPIVAPLLIWSDPQQAIYITRLVATVIFAILGAVYAQSLNRRKWLAALFLGTLCFSVSTLAFLAGW